jgi:hypothetical protein
LRFYEVKARGSAPRAIAFEIRGHPTPGDVVEQGTVNKSFCFFFQKEVLFLVLF